MNITPQQQEKTKKLSVIEGSAASIMLGFGEQYVVPFALQLGATSTQIGFLSSIPSFISSLFQIVGAKLTDKYMNRKRLVSFFVLWQALTFIPLFILPFLTKNFWFLVGGFTVYLIFGNLSGPIWSSWLGDVIPLSQRGKYFALRNKITILFLFSSVLIGGLILNHFENNIWLGFGILFSFAFIGRFTSFLLFLRHEEPTYQAEIWNDYTFRRFLEEIRTSPFGRFVVFRSLLSFSVMIASPFFALLMLQELHFTYVQFSVVVFTPMLIKALTMTYWGSLSNVFGNKNILRVSAVLIALIPVNWFLASVLFSGNAIFIAILFAEMISGFAWAGMELTTFNYMLEASNPRRRVKLFAYYNVVFNCLVMIGGLVGSLFIFFLIKKFVPFNAIMIVIIISLFARLFVALFLTPRVKEISNHEKIDDGRLFYEILVHRPLGFASSTAVSSMAFIENAVVGSQKPFSRRKTEREKAKKNR